MDKYLFVGTGGFVGAVLRYWLSGAVQQLSNSALFPVGTLVINVLGCFMIGFLSELAEEHGLFTAEARAFMFIGILGGFTTFSAFGLETVSLWRRGEMGMASLYVVTSVIVGMGALALSMRLMLKTSA